jgi:hypothetical protein
MWEDIFKVYAHILSALFYTITNLKRRENTVNAPDDIRPIDIS